MNKKYISTAEPHQWTLQRLPGNADNLYLAQYEATMCGAGRVRAQGGGMSKMVMTAEALGGNTSKFDGIPCFLDHPSFLSGPQTKDLAGRWFAPTMFGEELIGTIALFDTENGQMLKIILDAILDDMKNGITPPDLGFSIVFYAEAEPNEKTGDMEFKNIKHVDSCDFVATPAIANARVRAALSAHGFDPIYQESKQMLNQDGQTAQSNSQPNDQEENERVVTFTTRPDGTAPSALDASSTTVSANQANLAAEELRQLRAEYLHEIINLQIDRSNLPNVAKEVLRSQSFDSVEAVRDAISAKKEELARYAEETVIQIGGTAPRGGSSASMTTPLDQAQKIADWLFGVKNAEMPEPAMRKLSNWYVGLTGDREIIGRFNPDYVQFVGANTTDLADIATDAINKVLIQQWEGMWAYRWYEFIAAPVAHNGNLYDLNMMKISGDGTLTAIAEGGAFTEGTLNDSKEVATFSNEGKFIGVSRHIVKNDNVQALREIPTTLIDDTLLSRSAAFSNIFTQAAGVGPNMADGNPVFHASRNNVTADAFSEANWEAAAIECFGHTRLNGSALGIMPKYALVPRDLWYTARKTFGYGEGMPTAYTPFAQAFSEEDPLPVPIIVPDWSDGNDWAYAVDPRMNRTITVAYSQAPQGGTHPLPSVEILTSGDYTFFNDKVMALKVMNELAIGVADAAGLGKRNVV